MDSVENLRIHVDRPVYDIQKLQDRHHYRPQSPFSITTELKKRLSVKGCFTKEKVRNFIYSIIPIVYWLPTYNVKECLVGDIISGLTNAVLQIPLGMGYAVLASLPPINGIYMAFFPVIVYAIFGSSRHIQLGSLAVIMVMIGGVVDTYRTDLGQMSVLSNAVILTPTDIAVAVSVIGGIGQIILGILSAGYLLVFLSDSLLSAFTCAAGFHIVTTQMKYLLGLFIEKHIGIGKIIFIWRDIFIHIGETNIAALVTTLLSFTVLIFNNEFLKIIMKKKTAIPIPMELLTLVASTGIVYATNADELYNLEILGEVATGFPTPAVPTVILESTIIVQSFVISIIAFIFAYSMARVFAKKENYTVYPNQELVAQGLANLIGSFFCCTIISDAPARSLTTYSAGGKTMLSSLWSAFFLIFIILYMGPLVRTLPLAALSSIIIAAIRGVILKVFDVEYFWKRSKVDGCLWIITFMSVILLDIDYGLFIGFSVSFIIILSKNLRPNSSLVSLIPRTEIFVSPELYETEVNVDIKCFRFYGPLHFANREYFRDNLYNETGFNPVRWKTAMEKYNKKIRKENYKIFKMKRFDSSRPILVDKQTSQHCDGCVNQEVSQGAVGNDSDRFASSHIDLYELRHSKINFEKMKRKCCRGIGCTALPLDDLGSHEELHAVSIRKPALLSPSNHVRLHCKRSSITMGIHSMEPISMVEPDHHFDSSNEETFCIPESLRVPFKVLIIDFTAISSIDPSGIEMVLAIINDHHQAGVTVYICGIAAHILRTLIPFGIFNTHGECIVYCTLADAYQRAKYLIAAQEHSELPEKITCSSCNSKTETGPF